MMNTFVVNELYTNILLFLFLEGNGVGCES